MATHQSILTPISDFFLTSEVMTIQQIDSTVYKLKPRLFYKYVYLQDHPVDFHPGVNHTWQYYQTHKSAVASEQFCLHFNLTNSHFKVQMASSCHNSSTPVPLLGTLFHIILCFSDQMAYLPNVPWHSRQIHQRGRSSPRSPSSTIQPD